MLTFNVCMAIVSCIAIAITIVICITLYRVRYAVSCRVQEAISAIHDDYQEKKCGHVNHLNTLEDDDLLRIGEVEVDTETECDGINSIHCLEQPLIGDRHCMVLHPDYLL